MKVIFLDIDGVLNHDQWYVSKRYQDMQWDEDNELDVDPSCASRIVEICAQTASKVVISSSWRTSWYGTQFRLEKGGIPRDLILDKTPEFCWITIGNFDRSRSAEIQTWLDEHKNDVESYVIIDDQEVAKDDQLNHYVHVNPHIGFTEENKELAIKILNNEI